MRPKTRRVGEEVELNCPECEGAGIKITNTEEVDDNIEYPICTECHGRGKLRGTVTKN